MSHRAFALALLVACLLILVPAPVQAQTEAAARAHYERGVALFDEGQFTAALAEFEAAYEASHRAPILFNIGQLQARLGRAVEAVDTLRRYLTEGGDTVSGERRALVEAEIATQSARIATVTASVTVPGAAVSIDDVEVGTAPLPAALRVSAGEHVIAARADGFETARFRFRIAGGESQTVVLELVARGDGAGRLRLVIGVPGAEVRLDGRSIGLSPIDLPVGLPAGDHRIEVSRAGYEPIERAVSVPASGEGTLRLDLVRAASAPPGVLTRLVLALPSTSHTIRVDGLEIPPGTRSIELPFGLHDLGIEGQHMTPVRERIDVPQGPTFVFERTYAWEPTHRESLRTAAATQRLAGALTTVVGGVLGIGGGALLIGREIHGTDSRIVERRELVAYCNTPIPDAMGVLMLPEDCDTRVTMAFPTEGDLMAFERQTNDLLGLREGLAVSGGILVGAGAAALVAGIVVLALTPSDEQIDGSTTIPATVSLDVGPGGLSVRGTF